MIRRLVSNVWLKPPLDPTLVWVSREIFMNGSRCILSGEHVWLKPPLDPTLVQFSRGIAMNGSCCVLSGALLCV